MAAAATRVASMRRGVERAQDELTRASARYAAAAEKAAALRAQLAILQAQAVLQ